MSSHAAPTRRSRRQSGHRLVQLASAAVVVSAAWFAPWLVMNIDLTNQWLSIPFVVAFGYLVIQVHISIVNSWQWSSPRQVVVARGQEPMIAVILPTCGEPAEMVGRTISSVLAQDWPHTSLTIIVSDDANNPAMNAMALTLASKNPLVTIRYHRPPTRGTAARRGEAKAGNLNSALELVRSLNFRIKFIETRDADDEVGDSSFLRRSVGVLQNNSGTAFTQTIKECRVSRGDPFNNCEQLFYRGVMLGRHAANAVFPCGSGVVWRRGALDDIGGFPSWNLVEDFQSGVEVLKRGWRGAYIPIVGARAQHAPEDLGNVIKQRGTWALDTMRLLIWGSLKGMNMRQRLQFVDMALFYCQGFPMLLLTTTSIGYVIEGGQPASASMGYYMVHFLPYVGAVELYLWSMNRQARVSNVFAFRRIWQGMMFVHMKAVCMALFYGPRRKPVYKVTRKDDVHRWYLGATLPHILVMSAIAAALVYGAVAHGIVSIFRPDTAYWLLMMSLFVGSFIPLGWYGLTPLRTFRRRIYGQHGRSSADPIARAVSRTAPAPHPLPGSTPAAVLPIRRPTTHHLPPSAVQRNHQSSPVSIREGMKPKLRSPHQGWPFTNGKGRHRYRSGPCASRASSASWQESPPRGREVPDDSPQA